MVKIFKFKFSKLEPKLNLEIKFFFYNISKPNSKLQKGLRLYN